MRCRFRPIRRSCILTQEFIIDDQDGIREPIGMSGFRLEVKVLSSPARSPAAQNIVKCVRRCGHRGERPGPAALASGYAVLSGMRRISVSA